MLKRRLWLPVLLACMIGFTGCSNTYESESGGSGTMGFATDTVNAVDTYGAAEPELAKTSDAGEAGVNDISIPQYGDKIIYTGNVTLETADYDAAYQSLAGLVEEYDGYMESEYSGMSGNYYDSYIPAKDTNYRYADVSIRVPADKFDALTDNILEIDKTSVASKNISADDVTESYMDVELRLKNYKSKSDRLQALLKDAENVSEIVEIENALTDTAYQIESLEGQLKSYDSQVAYSTLHVRIQEVSVLSLSDHAAGYGGKLVQGLKSGFFDGVQFFADLSLWLAAHWLVIVAVVVAVLGIRAGCKKNNRLKVWLYKRRKKRDARKSVRDVVNGK